jgi:hypothetical protein
LLLLLDPNDEAKAEIGGAPGRRLASKETPGKIPEGIRKGATLNYPFRAADLRRCDTGEVSRLGRGSIPILGPLPEVAVEIVETGVASPLGANRVGRLTVGFEGNPNGN